MSLFGRKILELIGPHMPRIRYLASQGDSDALNIKSIHERCSKTGRTLEEDFNQVLVLVERIKGRP
jgi:hypothetical protein